MPLLSAVLAPRNAPDFFVECVLASPSPMVFLKRETGSVKTPTAKSRADDSVAG